MKPLAILIIENDRHRHETLWFSLRDIFPEGTATILPHHNTPCCDWETARKLIEHVPGHNELIVFVDLNLTGSDDPNDARKGVSECRRLHQLRPDAQYIAATGYERVAVERAAAGLFALVLSKYDDIWLPAQEQSRIVEYLREKIAYVRAGRMPSQTEIAPVLPSLTSGSPAKSVFISHSHSDSDIAVAIVELLCAALNLRRADFLCTSVDGCDLAGGARIDAQLRREIASTPSFVSVITPSSLQSHYVLFELGARWGCGASHIPLLAHGVNVDMLAPLKDTVALDLADEAKVHRFVQDVGNILGRSVEQPNSYLDKVRTVVHLAKAPRAKPRGSKGGLHGSGR
jgi:TIR domain-containing protein